LEPFVNSNFVLFPLFHSNNKDDLSSALFSTPQAKDANQIIY